MSDANGNPAPPRLTFVANLFLPFQVAARSLRDWGYYDEMLQAKCVQLLLDSATVTPAADQAPLRERLAALVRRGREAIPDWGYVFELEMTLVRVLPEADLRRRTWRLREEYRRQATADLFDAYSKSNPPSPETAPLQDLEADASFLLNELHRLRAGQLRLEVIRAYFSAATLVMAAVGILAMVAARYYLRGWNMAVLVPVTGMFGAFFSLMGRMYAIPAKGDLLDRASSTWRKVVWVLVPLVSAAQGMLSAFVLYLILAAGLGQISGTLFPAFKAEPFPANPLDAPSAAKLLVWCFVAGFAERLVPDVLGQLAAKADARGKGR